MVVQHVRIPRSPLLDLAATRWVAVPRRQPGVPDAFLERDPVLPLAFDDAHVLVYENRGAVPRVRIVHRAVPVADEDAARAWARRTGALTGHANDLGLGDMVMIEPDERGALPAVEPAPVSSREAVWSTD
jgi:hypothetical protein